MADDKLKTSPESPGQDRPGDTPVEDAPSMQEPPAPETAAPEKAAEHTEPEQSMIPGMGEGAPARPAPGEVVVDFDKINELMSQRRASARDAVSKAEAPSVEADGQEKAPKRRGRPPKQQERPTAEKTAKATEPRTGRPSKVDKAARDEPPSPPMDKVSRGKKSDKGKETGSGGAPASKSAKTVKPGKAAPVKEAAVPPPEIKLPPTPEVPPRPVEEGKIVYLKMAELHPFHTFRDHPYKVQDDRAMDDLVGTIREHGIMSDLLGGAKLPKMDALKKQRRELADKKKALYAEYRKAQADMREAVAVKGNIDCLLGYPDGREDKAQER